LRESKRNIPSMPATPVDNKIKQPMEGSLTPYSTPPNNSSNNHKKEYIPPEVEPGDVHQPIESVTRLLVELDEETINVFLTAEASMPSNIIKHPDSLRLLRSIEEDTSHLATAEPRNAKKATCPIPYNNYRGRITYIEETGIWASETDVTTRVKERVEGVVEKIKDMVKRIKRKKAKKLVRGEMIEDNKRWDVLERLKDLERKAADHQ
jgi:hypothetical protein